MLERIVLHCEEDSRRNIHDRIQLQKIRTNARVNQEIEIANHVLPILVRNCTDITIINRYLYAAATSVMERAGIKIGKCSKEPPKKQAPLWQRKMEKQIEKLRSDISILTEYAQNNITTNRARNKLRRTLKQEKIRNQNEAIQKSALKKLQLSALAKKLARTKWNEKEKQQNRLLAEDPTKLFRQLRGDQIEVQRPPTKEDLETFWRNIFERETTHNIRAQWIQQIEEDPKVRACEVMPNVRISLESLRKKDC